MTNDAASDAGGSDGPTDGSSSDAMADAAVDAGDGCDDDGDGVMDTSCGGQDCDDDDPEALPGGQEWTHESIVVWSRQLGGNQVGNDVYLSVGPDDAPHVLFSREVPLRPEGTIRLGKRTRTEWRLSTVEEREPWKQAVAVDDSGTAHVGYIDREQNVYRYVSGSNSNFEGEDAAELGGYEIGSGTGFALGPDGTPHVLYRREPDATLRLATRSEDGEWSEQTVPVPEGRGPADLARLALGPDGTPHVMHRLSNPPQFAVAVRSSSGWSTRPLGSSGQNPNITVTPDGTPHVMFQTREAGCDPCRADDYFVHHAFWQDDSWTTEQSRVVELGIGEDARGLCPMGGLVSGPGGVVMGTARCSAAVHLIWADEQGLGAKTAEDFRDEPDIDTIAGTSMDFDSEGGVHAAFMIGTFESRDGIPQLTTAEIQYLGTDGRDLDCDGRPW